MATAVAAAVASAASAAPEVIIHAPASPFAELLRRSRFASFDPAIRQTYSASKGDAHRGNWGLKRPIAQRRKNAFISLKSFESPAQYIEWNNAESQVRFIRRIEEMGTRPRVATGTPWHKGLGKATTQWVIDSEFCPEEEHAPNSNAETKNTTMDLLELGKKGPGQYGAKRGMPNQGRQDTHVTPNIYAMSRSEFLRYLRRLRELRPAFQEHIKENAKREPKLAGKSLYALAQNTEAGHHRQFLKEQAAKEYNDLLSEKIEQQPHPNAALMYSHPSALETHLTTKYQPGFVLQPVVQSKDRRGSFSIDGNVYEESFVASFGGLAATLKKQNAGGKRPLLDLASEQGIEQSQVQDSIANMRPTSRGLVLQMPPKVVGRNAQGLKAVKLNAEVTTDWKNTEFGKDNPYWPGTPEYNAASARSAKSRPRDFTMRPKLKPQLSNLYPSRKHTKTKSKQPIIATLQAICTPDSNGPAGGVFGGGDHDL